MVSQHSGATATIERTLLRKFFSTLSPEGHYALSGFLSTFLGESSEIQGLAAVAYDNLQRSLESGLTPQYLKNRMKLELTTSLELLQKSQRLSHGLSDLKTVLESVKSQSSG